ncbi:MAG: hypothetical protein VX367_02820, partial [SAR324 cluster bacterium]|nr:hypothetical protein [SAR324 cluster bacterium]
MKKNRTVSLFGFFILVSFSLHGQETDEAMTAMVLDSAPRKLYSELYSDSIGNQFMVEIYEEPLEGENLVHFRAFKNNELLARKSQALAESHNFSFFINETEDKLIRPEVQELLFQVLRTLFEESDEKSKTMLMELLQDEALAKNISKNLEQPNADVNEEQLAELLSKSIKPPPPEIDNSKLAEEVARQIKQPTVEIDEKKLENVMFSVLSKEEVAGKISNQIQPKPAVVDVDKLAEQLSVNIVPQVDEEALASRLSDKVKPQMDEEALAQRLTEKVQPRVDEEALAARLSESVQPTVDEEGLADRISNKIRPATVNINEDALATNLARKLTEKEKVAAAKIPKYAELIEQVEESNQEKDYAKTIRLLDEDIARRTPDEQQRVLKISGLMSVLVASKKLKTAISTIDDYDLPEDQALEQLSSSLEEWIQQNLI